MAVTIPTLANGDVLITGVNAISAAAQAGLNNLDGAALDAASVANSKLAKSKNVFAVSVYADSERWQVANVAGFYAFRLVNLDGVPNSTFKYLGASVAFRTIATVLGAGATFDVLNNAGAIHNVPIDSTKIAAVATPYQESLVTAVVCTSDDLISINFTAGGTGDVTGIQFVLFFSVEHVGT